MTKTNLKELNKILDSLLSPSSTRELETTFAKGDITAIGTKIIEISSVVAASSRWSVARGERPAALRASHDCL